MNVSINLTTGVSRHLTDAEIDAFGPPLMVTGATAVMEVVFWSAAFGWWVFLTREHTRRTFADGTREVTVDELPYYEQHIASAAHAVR